MVICACYNLVCSSAPDWLSRARRLSTAAELLEPEAALSALVVAAAVPAVAVPPAVACCWACCSFRNSASETIQDLVGDSKLPRTERHQGAQVVPFQQLPNDASFSACWP